MASFRKLSTGWEFRVSYKDSEGKYRRKVGKGFKTKVEATQAAAKIELALLHPEAKAREVSLSIFVEEWATLYKKPYVKTRTWMKYLVVFNNVKKHFGELPISKITRQKYQSVFNEMAQHFTQSTLKNLHVPIRAAVKAAIRDHVLTEDFTEGAIIKSNVPSMDEREKFLEVEEYLHVIEVSESRFETSSYFLIYLIAVTGMRFAEALGVTWEDIDFERKILTVNKSWDLAYTKNFSTTKNESSNRQIPLSDKSLSVLESYHKSQWVSNPENRLVTSVSSNAANKTLRHIVGRKVHCHSLRHTYASYLILRGVELISISQILGHKDLTITLSTYAHQLERLKEKSHEVIRGIFDNL